MVPVHVCFLPCGSRGIGNVFHPSHVVVENVDCHSLAMPAPLCSHMYGRSWLFSHGQSQHVLTWSNLSRSHVNKAVTSSHGWPCLFFTWSKLSSSRMVKIVSLAHGENCHIFTLSKLSRSHMVEVVTFSHGLAVTFSQRLSRHHRAVSQHS